MKLEDVRNSRFLRKEDLGDKKAVLLTIKSVGKENVAPKDAAPELKTCIHFVEPVKPLVCNSTNFLSILKFSGKDDSDNWVGLRIVVYFDDTISFGGKITGGLRVRAPKGKAAQTPVVEVTEETDGGADLF